MEPERKKRFWRQPRLGKASEVTPPEEIAGAPEPNGLSEIAPGGPAGQEPSGDPAAGKIANSGRADGDTAGIEEDEPRSADVEAPRQADDEGSDAPVTMIGTEGPDAEAGDSDPANQPAKVEPGLDGGSVSAEQAEAAVDDAAPEEAPEAEVVADRGVETVPAEPSPTPAPPPAPFPAPLADEAAAAAAATGAADPAATGAVDPAATGAVDPAATGAVDPAASGAAAAAVVAAAGDATAPGAARADVTADRLYELLWESGLLTVLTLARRELGSLFLSPIAYAVGALIIVPTSIFGYLLQINAGQPVSMAGVFNWVALMMVFFTPLYTMRLLAEEQRSGTLEQLLTSPVRYWELVLGKWLAGLAFFLATIAFTLVYVVLISVYQQLHTPATILGVHVSLPNVDYGSIFTGYVGVVLVGAAWVALGLLASSLTQNQIIAAISGIVLLLSFQYLFGALSGILAPPLSDFFDYMSAANRAQSFNQGQIVLRDVVFFIAVTAGALYLATRVVESRKWR